MSDRAYFLFVGLFFVFMLVPTCEGCTEDSTPAPNFGPSVGARFFNLF